MPPTNDTTNAFLHLPWAQALLHRPHARTLIPDSRRLKPRTADGADEDALFAELFAAPRALPSCIVTYLHKPQPERIQECHVLCLVGSALNGHRDTMHGGAIAAFLDEAMGMLQGVNTVREKERGGPGLGGMFTVTMKIQYRRPVTTPGAVCVRVRYDRTEGRKEWMTAEMVQWGESEEGEGIVCAVGEGFWVKPKERAESKM